MGITIIQKSDLSVKKSGARTALVLAGGAMSGGAFKIGGLKALNDYLVNKKLTNFDIYVGLSAGAMLAIPLAGGISPEEMLKSIDGKSSHFSQLSPFDLYWPNLPEFVSRPFNYFYGHLSFLPGVMIDVLRAMPNMDWPKLKKEIRDFLASPTYSKYEKLTTPFFKIAFSRRTIPSFGEIIPSGLFDNKPLERYLKENMRRSKMPDNFRVLKRTTGKSLYMTAMNLDTSENIVFGPDEKNDVAISEAVVASSAIPVFYKPARIKGVDYIDGGVRKTANIDLAFEKGADLVICYNPFRPYNNKIFVEYLREEKKFITRNNRLSDWGMGTVINQVFRTMFHSRLQYGLQNLRSDPNFKKDIIVIEPTEDDSDFFTMNPLFFWNRAKAAKLGFDSVTQSIEKHYEMISKILTAHGIEMTCEQIDEDRDIMKSSHFDDHVIMDVLENPHARRQRARTKSVQRLRMLSGGKLA